RYVALAAVHCLAAPRARGLRAAVAERRDAEAQARDEPAAEVLQAVLVAPVLLAAAVPDARIAAEELAQAAARSRDCADLARVRQVSQNRGGFVEPEALPAPVWQVPDAGLPGAAGFADELARVGVRTRGAAAE